MSGSGVVDILVSKFDPLFEDTFGSFLRGTRGHNLSEETVGLPFFCFPL
jgi:hypothetical protein